MSNVTRITNRNILYLFAILVIMSVACAIGGLVFTVNDAYLDVNKLLTRSNRFKKALILKVIYH